MKFQQPGKRVKSISAILIIQCIPMFFIVSMPFISCKKFLNIPLPQNEIQTVNVFETNQTAVSAVLGLYTAINSSSLNFCNGAMSIYPGLSADEVYNPATSIDLDPFATNSIPPANSNVLNNRIWTRAYEVIYHANTVLESLNKSDKLTDSIKQQLTGEAKFIRAFHYFYLVNLFGDIPLVLSTDYRENAIMPRTPVEKIYTQIVTDLLEAQNLLKVNYPSVNRARPNKWTATALLARVYLYKKEWSSAEAQSLAVLNSGLYSLSTISTVFTSISSNETIWQLAKDNANAADGINFVPATGSRPTYALTNHLISAFETGDTRKTNWVGSVTISTPSPAVTYYYPFKYKQRTGTTPTEYYKVFRLAEQFLILAEARARQNNLSGAIPQIDTLRTRAGLQRLPASFTQAQVLAAIEKENQIEFFAEWGHRWFDLKRNDKADAVLGTAKAPNWQSTDALYPIPQFQLDRNAMLIQNPGY